MESDGDRRTAVRRSPRSAFTGIFAILLGKRAQERIATSGARGAELASAGIVLGWIGIGLTVATTTFQLTMAALYG
jgi:hypothetical protein